MNLPATLITATLLALLLGTLSPVLANTDETKVDETAAANTGEAKVDETAPARELPSIDEFLSTQEELRKDLDAGEYGEFSDDDMLLIDRSQATLKELLSGVEDPADLSRDDLIKVYNAQEAIKAVLTDNVKNRPLCRRERSVGTHMSRMICYTPREKSQLEENAKDVFRNMGWVLPDLG